MGQILDAIYHRPVRRRQWRVARAAMAALSSGAVILGMAAGAVLGQPAAAGAQMVRPGTQTVRASGTQTVRASSRYPAEPSSQPGCPVPTPAQASAASPGAPTGVHAVAGDASVTVTWCPPVQGQSKVTSYTVTSSAGQKVTAQVPSSWAIVDGLTNGKPYSFTVTANTASSGSGPASASSPAVTPAPVAPPTHVLLGKSETVSYDQYSLMIGGKRTIIYSGEFDPWRTPSPSLWLDRLEKMKADGFNAVTPYFDWDYHSPSPGVYDFSGVRDVNEFLNLAQQVGLYVIARPGPYINAETDAGGFPGWLVTQPGKARTDAPDFVAASMQWYSEIDPIIAAHQITRGGDVILYQIENELEYNEPATAHYMAELEAKARADGINVPLTGNHGGVFQGGTGAVDIPGYDNYPLGFNCANTNNFGNPYGYPANPGVPIMLPEFQGGSFDGWGGVGFDKCYQMTGPDFENVYYKNNLAQGVTIQSNYMTVGGTDWGWLPEPGVYSSYDYGASIRESGEIGTPANPNDIAGSKYGENKLIADSIQAVPSLTKTVGVAAPAADNPAVTTMARANPDDHTQFVYLRQANAPSTATVSTHIALSTPAGNYPTVPQQGSITLQGRDSRLLVANDSFAGQRLSYSTSELMTQAQIGNRAVALLYGPKGTDGETVLRYESQPSVKVLSGSVSTTWDASRGDLRLDYVHGGLAEVSVTGGGRQPLLLLLAEQNVAEGFWPESSPAGPALVEGAYLVRTATASGSTLALTGDTSTAGPLTVWAPPGITGITWNGQPVATTTQADGSLSGTVPGPAPVSLPALTNWHFRYGTPEAQPGFDDSSWTLADHPVTTNPTTPSTTPVLYADDYGFHHGFVWYRGHFTATGSETGITLTAGGGGHGAYSVWLNGAFLGSSTSNGAARTFSFPARALEVGKDNVVAVLVENSGHDEDGVYGYAPQDSQKSPRGLMGATLEGSSAPITWRLQGNQGGETLQDPVRGVMNATGLYGTNHGWDLPGYPAGNWQPVSLPDNWSNRGLPPGVGWYRTSFQLQLPKQDYVPVAVQVGAPGPGSGGTANYRAFIFVNGWMVGQYDNQAGPQHQFYVPAGILNDRGANTLAIAVWGLDEAGGGLPAVQLAAMGNQAGGIPVQPVASPGYTAAVYGPPAAAQPTLGVNPSTTLVQPGQSFKVQATVSDPGPSPLANTAVSLSAPSGWTISPSGPQPLGTVRGGGSASASFTVTPPASGLSAGPYDDLLAQATFSQPGEPGSQLLRASLPLTIASGATPTQVTPVVSGVSPPAGSLQVVLHNSLDTSSTVSALDWTLGDRSGTQALDTTIAPHSSATVSADVGSPSFAGIYPVTVTSIASGVRSVPLSGHVTFLPVVQKNLGSSWPLSQVQDGPSVDLATTANGTWVSTGSQPYGGPADLSGKVWLNWDSTDLYVTAQLTDNVFAQPYTGGDIWQGDSIQLAATSGVPGASASVSTSSTGGHYEYGAALTSLGAQAYRWIAPPGVPTGPVTDATVHITRDDASHTTVYELALPWSDLTSIQPAANAVFSISLLANDNDGSGRNGYLQWGGGIGADKNVANFNMAQLMPASGS